MKTVTALPAPALSYKPRVKRLLIKGVIYLTSENFIIFAGAIGAFWLWCGVCMDDTEKILYGALIWLISFMPWALRQVLREIRQDRLCIKQK